MSHGPATKLTYDDYAAIDDGKRYELIEGELVLNPAPATKHQAILMALATELYNHVRSHDAGYVYVSPSDVVLSPENVLQPDIFYVSNEREAIITEKNVQGAPDLAVEILSDSSRRRDENSKRRLYERFGVTEYWLLDPIADSLRICRRREQQLVLVAELFAENGDTLTTPLLPGFAMPLTRVFVSR